MGQSTFNADMFLNTQVQGAMSTVSIPVPEGQWRAQIIKIGARRLEAQDDKEERKILDVTWEMLDDEPKQVTGQDKPMARQSIFLDFTPEGALDLSKGKNVQLGKLREALGQNRDGREWSFRQLQGGMAVVSVSHRPDEKTGEVFADVKKVANLSGSTGA